jgi:hypothetical protein
MRAERVLRRRERSRRACRRDAGRERERASKRAVSVLKVVMAMAGLGQTHYLGKDRLFFRKRASLGEV